MRLFAILPALSLLLALGHVAAVKITLTNEAGEKESYTECIRVSRKFLGSSNKVAASGGAVAYYSDSACKTMVFLDPDGSGTALSVSSRIKSFMIKRIDK
ncbi:hypothetical protein GGI17_000840 [Coemansia sp. S146]|nr:hypothetical protein GGI17_000840 [Coemansia sp. S146]